MAPEGLASYKLLMSWHLAYSPVDQLGVDQMGHYSTVDQLTQSISLAVDQIAIYE